MREVLTNLYIPEWENDESDESDEEEDEDDEQQTDKKN
jgi:hypothetical protein